MRHANDVASNPTAWFPWNYPRANESVPELEPPSSTAAAAR